MFFFLFLVFFLPVTAALFFCCLKITFKCLNTRASFPQIVFFLAQFWLTDTDWVCGFLQGESRMIRMQFDGCSMAEAINECSSAVEKLMEYIPVTTQDYAPLQPNQPPAAVPVPAVQVAQLLFHLIQFQHQKQN